jgi:fluoride exporter
VRIFLLLVLGAAGTLARYGLQGVIQNRTGPEFPSGTLVVNVLGSFLVGLAGQYSLNHLSISPEWRIGLTIGFLGAFTTFSSLSWETVRMLEVGEWLNVALYLTASFLGGIFAAMLGIKIGNIL